MGWANINAAQLAKCHLHEQCQITEARWANELKAARSDLPYPACRYGVLGKTSSASQSAPPPAFIRWNGSSQRQTPRHVAKTRTPSQAQRSPSRAAVWYRRFLLMDFRASLGSPTWLEALEYASSVSSKLAPITLIGWKGSAAADRVSSSGFLRPARKA
eukprot:scaffold133_cov407-Prasinococcus_capsulatus_cf.AAC.18